MTVDESSTSSDVTTWCCPAATELTGVQAAWLNALPMGGNEVTKQQSCELQFGHDGMHASLGQISSHEWWVFWSLAASEVRRQAGCPVETDERGAFDDEPLHACMLFEGHPGLHSYEIRQP